MRRFRKMDFLFIWKEAYRGTLHLLHPTENRYVWNCSFLFEISPLLSYIQISMYKEWPENNAKAKIDPSSKAAEDWSNHDTNCRPWNRSNGADLSVGPQYEYQPCRGTCRKLLGANIHQASSSLARHVWKFHWLSNLSISNDIIFSNPYG